MTRRRTTRGNKRRMTRRRTTRGGMGKAIGYQPTTRERATEVDDLIRALDELISKAGNTPHGAGLRAHRKVIFDAEAIKSMSSLSLDERAELLANSRREYATAYSNAGGM